MSRKLRTQSRKLDLTDNFFNGVLSGTAGKLRELEELRLDVNQVSFLRPTALCCSCRQVPNLNSQLLRGPGTRL